ncbi:Hypothetical predicted protein, partial [Prunus dulcis]
MPRRTAQDHYTSPEKVSINQPIILMPCLVTSPHYSSKGTIYTWRDSRNFIPFTSFGNNSLTGSSPHKVGDL